MINRDFVLKNFWEKLREAKRQNVRDVRMTLKEIDELGYVIYELLTEYYNKTIDNVKQSSSDNDSEESFKMDGGSF